MGTYTIWLGIWVTASLSWGSIVNISDSYDEYSLKLSFLNLIRLENLIQDSS